MSNSSSTSDSRSSASYDQYDDPLYLSSVDQPHLQLTPYLFDGSNFLDWKRDVLMALTAKNKECFLTDVCKLPTSSIKKRNQWNRCDLMVLRWLLNSLSKPIRDNVLYAKSSKELWSELNDRYGQLNSLALYQLKKEVSGLGQGNSSLVDYYGQLKRNWESVDSVDPIPDCTCGALKLCTCQLMKRILDRDTHSKLIQLLMGLNSSYESVTTHVLSMDPLPPINKALGLLQKIEKQKEIADVVSDGLHDTSAYNVSKHASTSVQSWKKPRLNKVDKSSQECAHCLRKGHTIDDCFKLKTCDYCQSKGHIMEHCYKWKNHSAKSGKSASFRRNAHNVGVISPSYVDASPLEIFDVPQSSDISRHVPHSQKMMTPADVHGILQNVVNQVFQAFSDKATDDQTSHSLHSSGMIMSSSVFSVSHDISVLEWIVDTGASDHMTSHISLLHNIHHLSRPMLVALIP
ncbi:hypothetical protein vseg_020580 [Gypsophila vaccaria]